MTDSDADPDAGTPGRSGSRIVLVLYVVLIGVAGTAGFLTGVFVDGLEPPMFLFLIPFPPTPVGFALYGALTVALVLGAPLALVVYVSRHVDDAEPGR